MKFTSIAIVLSATSFAYAQLPGPACALDCFIDGLSGDGCSSLLDFECHCKNGQGLISKIEPCVIDACPDGKDLQGVLSTVNAVCKQYDVVLSISLPASLSSLAAAASTVAPITGLDASSVLASSILATTPGSASAKTTESSSESASSSASSASEAASSLETSNPFGFLSSIASEITSGATRTLSIVTTPTNTGSTAKTLEATPSTTALSGFAVPRDVSGGIIGAVIAIAAAII